MDFERACVLLNAAETIEAQELLAQFKSTDWPHLKKQEREKTHRKLHKLAYPFEWNNSAPLSLEDAAKRLSGLSFPKGGGK